MVIESFAPIFVTAILTRVANPREGRGIDLIDAMPVLHVYAGDESKNLDPVRLSACVWLRGVSPSMQIRPEPHYLRVGMDIGIGRLIDVVPKQQIDNRLETGLTRFDIEISLAQMHAARREVANFFFYLDERPVADLPLILIREAK